MALSDPYISVEAYLKIDRQSELRYEYIDGDAYALAGGTLNHSIISTNLGRVIGNALRGSGCRTYSSDARVRLSETRYVYPDLTVSCDENDTGTTDILLSPRVVVEVLSPGTENYDRGKKFDYYRQCPTIQEYLLIDTQRPAVDILRRASTDLWTYHSFREGEQVVIACLNTEFSLNEIYEQTRL